MRMIQLLKLERFCDFDKGKYLKWYKYMYYFKNNFLFLLYFYIFVCKI